MTNYPSGTVTFLFTDIEGSTKLAQEYPDAERDKIGDHRPPIEQASVDKDLAIIRSQIDDITYKELWKQGRALSQEQAIALALEN